ncbi:MAG TPA: hypothetical protein VFE69_09680, partial [Ilumatobacteraceae bacterium]|nr:hypothetical protein [Ilumatobacteraceae bacterium]
AGTSGGGGSGGMLGAIVGNPLATFDTGTQSFILDDYMDSDPTYTNIANKPKWADKGKTPPTLTHNTSDGSPSPGSLQVVAPFDGKNQHFDVQSPSLAPLQNWTGGTLHVRIRITDGSLSAGAGAQLFVKTTMQYVYGGSYVNFPTTGQGNWKDFTIALDSPMTKNTGYDISQAISYGVQVNTGSSVAAQGSVTFEIDSFAVSGVATGAAGTTGAGGTADASTGN